MASHPHPQDIFPLWSGAVNTPDKQLANVLNLMGYNSLPKLCEACFMLEDAWQHRRFVDAAGNEYPTKHAFAEAVMPSICNAFGKTWRSKESAQKLIHDYARYHRIYQDLPSKPTTTEQLKALQCIYATKSPVPPALRKTLACDAWADALKMRVFPSGRILKLAVADVMAANGIKWFDPDKNAQAYASGSEATTHGSSAGPSRTSNDLQASAASAPRRQEVGRIWYM